MRAVVQRVAWARVLVDAHVIGHIGRGLLVLVGIGATDGPDDVAYVAGKLRDLRIFNDSQGKLNLSVQEIGGAVLVVSQFTLYGDCRKGRRPSFISAASPAVARPLYEDLLRRLRADGLPVEAGEFKAMMQVELQNDGPVTLLLDSTGSD